MSNYSASKFDKNNENTSWYKAYNFIPNQSLVLDIGCSSGNFGKVLINDKKCIVDGIEINTTDAKRASKILRKVWVKDIEKDKLDYLNDKYDVIYLGDVIEHLVDPISVLKNIKKYLSKKGFILFSIPNMGYLEVRLDLLRGEFEYTETGLLDKTHLHFYTQNEIFRIFNESGFNITNLDFVKKDYPKDLIKNVLKNIGLNANTKFYELMADTSASAFQFVGKAYSSNINSHKLKDFGPIDMFEEFYINTKKDYENKIKKQSDQIKILQQRIEEINKNPYKFFIKTIKSKLKK
jgi:2-polyprenyl-3-methyl-5-hydroxy-6-metoxy-1,4-benzoquinol methylase